MPGSRDYRLYLEEKFKGLHESVDNGFKEVSHELGEIKEQTIKTNNRVTNLEVDSEERRRIIEDLEKESIKRQEAVNDFREMEDKVNGIFNYIYKHWWKLLICTILFIALVIFLYDLGFVSTDKLVKVILK